MLTLFGIGMAAVAASVVVQTNIIWLALRFLTRALARSSAWHATWAEPSVLPVVALLMFLGHLVQIGIWAVVFQAVGEFDGMVPAYYHSAVNFTTLGYGDVVMSEQWRLLGALEAASGVLMFGVSTAAFFAVIMKLIERRVQAESHSQP